MSPELRRIIAVQAHLRVSGHRAKIEHALGTGESFGISLTRDGFRDEASGLEARLDQGFSVDGQQIELTPRDNVIFDGLLCGTGARFTLRAGGGASVTLYVGADWFQDALVTA